MTKLRTAVLAATILALPVSAVAQNTAKGPATPERVGIADAISAAKARIDGGVLEAELENDGGVTIWEIDIVSGETIHEVKVNSTSGEVLSTDEKRIEGTWRGWFDEDRLSAAQRVSGTLTDHIKAAEGQLGAPIVELSLDEEDDRLVYEFEVRTATGDEDMLLDPETGTVSPDD